MNQTTATSRFALACIAGVGGLYFGGSAAAVSSPPGNQPVSDNATTRQTPAQPALAQKSDAQPPPKTEAKRRAERERLRQERMKDPVTLRKLPKITLQKRPAIGPEETQKIKSLILSLSKYNRRDDYFLANVEEQRFLPIDWQSKTSVLDIDLHGSDTSAALKQLVAYGPDALPFLLEALHYHTPTKLTFTNEGRISGYYFVRRQLPGNPLNQTEAKVLKLGKYAESHNETREGKRLTGLEHPVKKFTIKVGDLCFVVIGQIVGRSYDLYGGVGAIGINSPTHDLELTTKVREIWTSDNPRELLFESLLRDYASEGKYFGDSLDVWDVGSRLQCGAVLRLLYYFPNETADLIANRINTLDVAGTDRPGRQDRFAEREVKNGVRTDDFIQAVAWCREPAIRKAVTGVFLRTTDEDVLLAAIPGVDDPKDEIIPGRLQPLLDQLPPDGTHGWSILLPWTKAAPDSAKRAMEGYIKNGDAYRVQVTCEVLSETSPQWKIPFLRPFLNDKRNVPSLPYWDVRGFEGMDIPVRLCDLAASIIADEDQSISFILEGSIKDVDRQIDRIKQQLDQRNSKE